jgi:SAM-dependent methyltransferase
MSEYDVDAFEAFEQEGWATKDVAEYDRLAGRVTAHLVEPLLDAADVRAGTRLLDVATGPGYVARAAVEREAEPVGVDLSEVMLDHARSRTHGIEFVHGDATALPFADESFDAVVGAFVLLHLGRPEAAVAEAARVLVGGGRAAFTVWNVPSRARWLGVMLDAVAAAGATPPADIPAGPPLFHYADEREFTALLTGAGLADVAVQTLDFALELDGADELWHGLIEGSVRVRPLVLSQTEEARDEIRAHFDALLDDYRVAAGAFEVPVSVKLASGRKP